MSQINKSCFNFIEKYFIFLVAIVLLGGFLRFYRLGVLPIDGDNSYHALAAKAITESGMPVMPNGKVYIRALPLMYLEAFSLKIFGFNEWSLRFPNALIGTINIVLVYLLIMTFCSKKELAIVTALFFSLSPWAITISRTPRMYETFLMAVLLVWILFYRWYYFKNKILIIPLVLVSITAISLHQEAIIPLLCFVTPLALEREFRKDIMMSVACFVFLFAVWYYYNSVFIHLFYQT